MPVDIEEESVSAESEEGEVLPDSEEGDAEVLGGEFVGVLVGVSEGNVGVGEDVGVSDGELSEADNESLGFEDIDCVGVLDEAVAASEAEEAAGSDSELVGRALEVVPVGVEVLEEVPADEAVPPEDDTTAGEPAVEAGVEAEGGVADAAGDAAGD